MKKQIKKSKLTFEKWFLAKYLPIAFGVMLLIIVGSYIYVVYIK